MTHLQSGVSRVEIRGQLTGEGSLRGSEVLHLRSLSQGLRRTLNSSELSLRVSPGCGNHTPSCPKEVLKRRKFRASPERPPSYLRIILCLLNPKDLWRRSLSLGSRSLP